MTTLAGKPGDLADAVVSIEDVRTYLPTPKGVVRAVDGVSLSLMAGASLGIVGESGSGKSMLLRSIINILPRSAVRAGGSVKFQGHDLRSMRAADLRKIWGPGIGIVFQDPNTSLNPVMRVEQQIIEGPLLHKQTQRAEARRLAVKLLGQVGIPEPERHLRSYPHQLSGGMRQRVAIAVALACNPRLLLADEITSALDVSVQAQTMDVLALAQQERGMSMIFVTHNMGIIVDRTDEIAVMYAGRIVERAPTRTIFAMPRHPYTRALIDCVPSLGAPSGARVSSIPGAPLDPVAPFRGCAFSPRCQFAQERCLVEDPTLDRHGLSSFACFYPVGTPSGEAALDLNRRRGSTAAGLPLPAATPV